MPELDSVVEAIRREAGADFAFVLTRKGRLVTMDAPTDMPADGRKLLVDAAKRVSGSNELATVTVPRQALVPYGGAAPVDVWIAVEQEAIVCLVMASWTDPGRLPQAVTTGRPLIGSVLQGAAKKGKRRRRQMTSRARMATTSGRRSVPPPPGAIEPTPAQRLAARARTGRVELGGTPVIPSTPAAVSGLVALAGPAVEPNAKLRQSPKIQGAPPPLPARGGQRGSMPSITLGTAPVGRDTLAAIDADEEEIATAAAAAIAGKGPGLGSMPDIAIGMAGLGRESLAAVDDDAHAGVPTGSPQASMPDVRLSLASMPDVQDELRQAKERAVPGQHQAGVISPGDRLTQPWAESPIDTKRYADAAKSVRGVAPPRVSARLTTLDEDTLVALVEDQMEHDSAKPKGPPPLPTAEKRAAPSDNPPPRRKRQSAGPPPVGPDGTPLESPAVPGSPRQPMSTLGFDEKRPPSESKENLNVWHSAIEKMFDEDKPRVPPEKSGKRKIDS